MPQSVATSQARADDRTLSRAERAKMPRAIEVLEEIATNHGVCVHPIPVRRVDRGTGEAEIIPLPCRATLASKCAPCAERARRLRMHQCREGWHLDTEPDLTPDPPSEEQAALIRWRAALEDARADAPPDQWAEIDAEVTAVDEEITAAGIRGHLTAPDGDGKSDRKPRRKRSTRAAAGHPVAAVPAGR